MLRPGLTFLDTATIRRIIEEAVSLLDDPGVRVHSERGLALLDGAGAQIDYAERTAHIPPDLIQKCLDTVPRSFSLYGSLGSLVVHYQDDIVHFDPGSTAIEIVDYQTRKSRQPVTRDLVTAARLVDVLPALDATSTCMVSSDVPETISDLYRLFLVLLNSQKPVVTGAFAVDTWPVMHKMLAAVSGSEDALRHKPIAIFDVCPSPPLLWTEITGENLIDCALTGVPAQIVSMPMTGATAPVTLLGAVVQHAAETLSGITIHQLAGPGSPVVWGGAPVAFDMRTGNTPMGAVETQMISAAYVQVGKSLGLPTHAYMGSSDAKIVDAQAGFESAVGTVLAALSGVNMISSAGMLDFERCFSLEKLIIDAEIIDMARRLIKGMSARGDSSALQIIREVGHDGNFLEHDSTLRWFKEELRQPGPVVDRDFRQEWELKGEQDIRERAYHHIQDLLGRWQPPGLSDDVVKELRHIVSSAAQTAGMDELPEW